MNSKPSQPAKKNLVDVEATLRSTFSTATIPVELQDAAISSFTQMIGSYRGSQLRPSELNGGDFTEAIARILQFLATGKYTPLGKTLPRMDVLLVEMQRSTLDDSFRIHVPRHLQAMYDMRNRRGVGHLPGPVSANKPDAELIVVTARWILAEFVRVYLGLTDHLRAQRVVDLLSETEVPLVENFEGTLRVISKYSYSIPEKVLILLWSSRQDLTSDKLIQSLPTKRNAVLVSISRLIQKDLLHRFDDGRLRLTSLGRSKAHELSSRDPL